MSDQPRNSGPSSSGSTPTSTAKKRQRLTALTPAGLLRQRKRRGSSTSGGGGGNNGRTPGSSRPGTPTPTKLRASMSQGSLAWQDSATSGPERRGSFSGGRRGSMLGLTSSVAGPESASSRHGSLVHPRTASMHEAAGGGDAVQQRRGGKQRISSVGGAGLAVGSGSNETADHEDNDDGNDDDDDANAAEGADGLTLVRQSKEEVKELWDQMSDEQKQRYGV
ncbi:hypothetical protein GGI11_002503, partial [Coemansia sp. RSA 2049]